MTCEELEGAQAAEASRITELEAQLSALAAHTAEPAADALGRQYCREPPIASSRSFAVSLPRSPEWATAWKAVLANRWASYEAGSDPGVPFDEEIESVRSELRATRQ